MTDCDVQETTSPIIGGSTAPIKTGLSRSSTSLSSEQHQSYCYTNQQCYDTCGYGYTSYHGYVNDAPLMKLQDDNCNKPKITAALYKIPKTETLGNNEEDFD